MVSDATGAGGAFLAAFFGAAFLGAAFLGAAFAPFFAGGALAGAFLDLVELNMLIEAADGAILIDLGCVKEAMPAMLKAAHWHMREARTRKRALQRAIAMTPGGFSQVFHWNSILPLFLKVLAGFMQPLPLKTYS